MSDTDNMMLVGSYARESGIPSAKLIEGIRAGEYVGRKVGAEWYIDPTGATAQTSDQSPAAGSEAQRVVVADFDMPFSSMVGFMVKWALASVPAFLILLVVFSVVLGIFGTALGVLFGGFLDGAGY